MGPVIAFLFVAVFTEPNGSMAILSVPGLSDAKLSLKMNAPKFACHEYRAAAPQIDIVDALDDARADGIIR
jgi:hypothetical protein